jgi:hypothetical protein
VAAIASVSLSVILRTIWNDLGEIFRRLRREAIVAFLIIVTLGIIGSAPVISRNPVLAEAFSLLSMIAILPFEIAVFRLLILDEAAPGYQFATSTVRFRRMLVWTVAFWAISSLPALLSPVVVSFDLPMAIGIVAALVVFFIVVVVMLRIVILLPAIAVDAPGASIGNVFADTRDHAWFILKAYLAVVLLFLLAIVLTAVLAWLGGGSGIFHGSGGSAVALGTIFSSLGFLMATSLMIVQARLFMRIGDRVKRDVTSAGD